MKTLSSIFILNTNGADRISFTYDVVDDNTGTVMEPNVKESFVVVDPALRNHVSSIQQWLEENKLNN